MAGFKTLKQDFHILLQHDDWRREFTPYLDLSLRKILGPLFSLLLDPEPLVKWRAVSAFGFVVSRLAHQDMESARVVMRRLMWNLNEESGAIGWGAPECMGESMACHPTLASEYHRVLISYAQEPLRGDGNYLDHEPLRQGAYWGICRLAEVRPALVMTTRPVFLTALNEETARSQALSLWGLGYVGEPADAEVLAEFALNQQCVDLYRNETLQQVCLADLAREAGLLIQQRHKANPE